MRDVAVTGVQTCALPICRARDGAAAGPGAAAGGGAVSRTTELLRPPPRSARLNDVRVKTTGIAPVILVSTVGVPIEPKTAWLPAPPNADPISAPLPACRSTIPMIAKDAMT